MANLGSILAKYGVDQDLAKKFKSLPVRCESFEAYSIILGPPDEVVEWNLSSEKVYVELKASGKAVKRWRRKYHYINNVEPLRLAICETDDGFFCIEIGLSDVTSGPGGRDMVSPESG